MSRFLCICLSATIQRTVSFRYLETAAVNRSEKYRMDASGKAVNAARVLNQLESGCASAVCPLGEKNAALFTELAGRDGFEVLAVNVPGFTRECWTLLDRMRGTSTELVVNEESAGCDFKDGEDRLLDVISAEMKKADAVLLAGSRPPCWSEGLSAYIARMAVESGRVLLADYCGEDLERTAAVCTPDIIKINEEEFLKTFSLPHFMSEEALRGAITEKSREFGNIIVVTRGPAPTFAAENGIFAAFPAETVKTVNTTACGDSFSAGFLYEYLETGLFCDALAKGTWCAARNAERECPGAIIG